MICSLVFTSGAGNVLFRADELHQLRGVAPGDALQLAHGELVRIADDSALGAAEGNVDHGALPGHPGRQRAHLVEREVGRVADAALGGAARDRVLHPVSGKHFQAAVVHGHGDVHDDLAGGVAQDLPQTLVEVQLAGGQVKPRRLRFPGIGLLLQRDRAHGRLR